MKTLNLALLLLFISALVHLQADAASDTQQKLDAISNPPMVVTNDQAIVSPTVILTDKGAIINKSATPVPFDHVLAALAALPTGAWPYGRIVQYSPAPIGLPGATAPAKAVADKVEADMQNANIRVIHY